MQGKFLDSNSGIVDITGVPDLELEALIEASDEQTELEPVFIIRARDRFAQAVLSEYARQCELHGIMSVRIRTKEAVAHFDQWQGRHLDQLRFPD